MIHSEIMNLYDAVTSDDGVMVERILAENLVSQSQISVKTITGLLVIAIENKLINASKAILNYNKIATNKITDTHFNSIICLAAKSDLLQQLKITYH